MSSSLNTSYLSSAYLPPIDYIKVVSKSEKTYIESCENFQKQSYRNRCNIYSANGILPLIIPVLRNEIHSVKISEVKIDYSRNWQKQHWRAIESAYKSSPFFDYYMDDFVAFYNEQESSLYDFNTKLLKLILDIIGVDYSLNATESFKREIPLGDFREIIHPKRQPLFDKNENGQYHQVFAHKHGFIPNLSIIDLLFNEGPDAISYI